MGHLLRRTLVVLAITLTVPAAPEASTWAVRFDQERAMAARDPERAPRRDGASVHLVSPELGAHRPATAGRIDAEAMHVATGDGSIALSVAAIGRRDRPRAFGEASPVIDGPEVRREIAPGVIEWWRSLASGLEHGVTLAARPDGEGPLIIDVAVHGATPSTESPDVIALRDDVGGVVARYAHVVARDRQGTEVPARLAAVAGAIRLEVDDRRARYPLVVDPLVYSIGEVALTPAAPVTLMEFGRALASSRDGMRAIVGAPGDVVASATVGRAYVLRLSSGSWIREATLTHTDRASGDEFGRSVALDDTGLRAVVGIPRDDVGANANQGSARVFLRSGTSWTAEATLSDAAGAADDWFGASVDIDDAGTRIVVGVQRGGSTDVGGARVFVRSPSGTSWSLEATLPFSGATNNDEYGTSVAISGNGTRVIVGAPLGDTAGGSNAGAARVFRWSTSTWTAETTLAPAGAAAQDNFGSSVDLSIDGSRAIVGAPGDDPTGSDSGAGYAFVRSGTSWTLEGTLTSVDTGGERLGESAALSSDGSRVVLGAPSRSAPSRISIGGARVFVRTASTWTHELLLTPATGLSLDQHGNAVGLDGTGALVMVGGANADSPSTNVGTVTNFSIAAGRANGATCTTGGECATGVCTEGVCCNIACGTGAASECQSCRASRTGGADGVCSMVRSGTECRASTRGLCDAPETCTGTSATCPADDEYPASRVCRAAAGVCDVAELCDGVSPSCPGDAVANVGVVCRIAASSCDVPENCTGTTVECPDDGFAAAGVVCEPVGGTCDVEDRCTGASGTCPSTVLPAGMPCRASTGPCDPGEACTGLRVCPDDVILAAGTPCGPDVAGVCDMPDQCDGLTGACAAAYRVDVECRPAEGACDLPELCSGASAECPPDALIEAGITCRSATDPSCDTPESCDGTNTSCPADETTCEMPDSGGVDAGADGGSTGTDDAGVPPAATTGCGCAAARADRGVASVLVGLLLVVSVALRRRGRVRRR